MPVDASIPLGIQQPNSMQTLSSLLSMKSAVNQQALQQQALQSGGMENQQKAIDLQETQSAQGILRNIKQYQDQDGNVDFNKLMPDMMQAAPKNGPRFIQNVMAMQQQATEAKRTWMAAGDDQRRAVGGIAASLKGQSPSVVADTLEQLRKSPAYSSLLPSLDHFAAVIKAAPDQKSVDETLDRIAAQSQTPQAQQEMKSPNVSFVSTENGTQPFNTKAGIPGTPVGPVGTPMAPPNQLAQTPSGGTALVNPARGTARDLNGGTPMNFPQGETAQTQAELQAQRLAAQQAANQAPTQHNLNRNIIHLVDAGVTTGKLGSGLQELASKFGFKLSGDQATDFDLLGKYLERSALTAAQGMGPHTNAGLEAQVRANGSQGYTPQAIRNIAALNDAVTTGTSMYQAGLEKAVSGPQGVFHKRQFDQQWAQAMNPESGVDGIQAMRFKNAVDAGDKHEVQTLISEVGGAKSKGAKALYTKLQQIRSLAGEQ